MKYFSEKTGKLYDKKEQLEQAEQEYDAKDKEKEVLKSKLKELKNTVDKITKEYHEAIAKVETAKHEAAQVEKKLEEANSAYRKQEAKIKAKEIYAPDKDNLIFDLDPAVSALLRYFGY